MLLFMGSISTLIYTSKLTLCFTICELRASFLAELRRPIFGAKIEAWKHKMVHIFHFLQASMVFETVNPFSRIFYAISREKSCLISMPFLICLLDIRTLDFFPPAESWLVNSNFPRASRMQGCFPISNRKWSNEGVMERNCALTTTWKIIFSNLKM